MSLDQRVRKTRSRPSLAKSFFNPYTTLGLLTALVVGSATEGYRRFEEELNNDETGLLIIGYAVSGFSGLAGLAFGVGSVREERRYRMREYESATKYNRRHQQH